MLQYSETQNPKAIEENICLKIKQSPHLEMDNETTEILMRLINAKNKNFEIPENEKPFLYAVIEKRIKHCFQFIINDNRLILMLTQISKSPGAAIMILWYLQWWCANHDCKELDLEIFCEKIFPMGFPSQNALHSIWDSQKVKTSIENRGSDNLVDYASAGQSLLFFGSVSTE